MFKKKIFAVVDTETTGSIGFPLIYDLGISICDKRGRILGSKNWIIKEIYYNQFLMNSAFYGKKRPMYDRLIAEGQIPVVSYRKAIYELNQFMENNQVSILSAYNLEFDLRALTSTQKFTKLTWQKSSPTNSLLWKDYQLQDIWGLACEILFQQTTFEKFVRRQNYFSEKGNPRTNAEIGFQYISNNPNFVEDHTALSDTKIECQLLGKALRQKKKYTRGIIPNPWKLVAQKFKRN